MRKFLAAALVSAFVLTPAFAHHDGEQFRVTDAVSVNHAYTIANAAMAQGMRVYLTVQNTGSEPVVLTGASVDFADDIRFMAQTIKDGTLETTSLEQIRVDAGQTLTMQPGAVWVELDGVHETFSAGNHFHMTVEFEGLGSTEIDVEVEANPDGAPQPHDHDHEADQGAV